VRNELGYHQWDRFIRVFIAWMNIDIHHENLREIIVNVYLPTLDIRKSDRKAHDSDGTYPSTSCPG
jgi:hypothetical protein